MWEETRESSGRFFGTHPYNGVGSILSRRDMLVLLAIEEEPCSQRATVMKRHARIRPLLGALRPNQAEQLDLG